MPYFFFANASIIYIYMYRSNFKEQGFSWRYPRALGENSFISDLINRTTELCKALLEKQERTNKKYSPVDSYTRTHQCWSTSKHLDASTGLVWFGFFV